MTSSPLWWSRRVMVKLPGYGEAAGLWWSRRVVVKQPGYGEAAGLWWSRRVVVKPPGCGEAAGLWWSRRVVVKPPGYGGAAGLWWSSRVRVKPPGCGEAAGLDTCVFSVMLSVEHHQWDSINAPPYSEACFYFEAGLTWGALHKWDLSEILWLAPVTAEHGASQGWVSMLPLFVRVVFPHKCEVLILKMGSCYDGTLLWWDPAMMGPRYDGI